VSWPLPLVGFSSRDSFYRSYLFAYLFWIGLTMGCLGIVMLHHLMGGEWGICVRRFAEAGAMVMPLMLILFIPIALGLRHLYPWARPDEVAADPVLQHKQPYLNIGFLPHSGRQSTAWRGSQSHGGCGADRWLWIGSSTREFSGDFIRSAPAEC